MKIAIVGAGIGGLTAGIALRKRGFDVTVYERAESFKEVGTGITLSPNATAVMRGLDVLDDLRAVAQAIETARFANATGDILAATDIARISDILGVPMLGIHRARLHEVLAGALGEENIRCGYELNSVAQDADGVTLGFANGERVTADIAVGADGLRSATRRLAFDEAETLRDAGQQCWRGVLPLDAIPEFPAEQHTRATEYWGRGARFGTVPIGCGQLYWYATLSNALVDFDPSDVDAFRAAFGQRMCTLASAIVTRTDDAAVVVAPIGDRPPCACWHTGRVVLLGDSVHSTTPNMGQGACMAIESAWTLAECLGDSDDPAAAFAHYQSAREKRTRMITERSLRMGSLFQTQNRFLAGIRNTLIRIVPASMTRNALVSMFRESPAL